MPTFGGNSEHIGETEGEYSVCQWFPAPAHQAAGKLGIWDEANCRWEYTRRWVNAVEASKAFTHYISSVGARLGTTVRVVITDGGDFTNMEWIWSEGMVYPEEYKGQFKNGIGKPNDSR